MRALVIFGSTSDQAVSDRVCKSLTMSQINGTQIKVSQQFISAHREPEKLKKYLQLENFDFIVAGAGLAAHLPGVVASLVDTPVFGVAANKNFSGFDAFMSIAQMPAGVPVLAVTENNIEAIAQFITETDFTNSLKIKFPKDAEANYSNSTEHFIFNEWEKAKKRALEIDLPVDITTEESAANAIIVGLQDVALTSNKMMILAMDQMHLKDPQNALAFFDLAKKQGLWLGVNNLRNMVEIWNKLRVMKKN